MKFGGLLIKRKGEEAKDWFGEVCKYPFQVVHRMKKDRFNCGKDKHIIKQFPLLEILLL